jgi:hypothetical protein
LDCSSSNRAKFEPARRERDPVWPRAFVEKGGAVTHSRFFPPSTSEDFPKRSWFLSASVNRLRVLALGVALAVFVSGLGIDYLLMQHGVSPLVALEISNGVAAIMAALLVLNVVKSANRRVHGVHARLRLVAEMNHHVRNALEVIQFSAHSTRDAEAIRRIGEGVKRIEWALNAILGSVEEDTGAEPPRQPFAHDGGEIIPESAEEQLRPRAGVC